MKEFYLAHARTMIMMAKAMPKELRQNYLDRAKADVEAYKAMLDLEEITDIIEYEFLKVA